MSIYKQTETPKNWLDGSSYLSRGIENKPRNLDRKGMYRGAIEHLSRSLKQGFQEGEIAQDECNQDRHQNKQPRRMLSTQTHHQF